MNRSAMARSAGAVMTGTALALVCLLPAAAARAASAGPPGGAVASVTPATVAVGGQAAVTVSCASADAEAASVLGRTLGLAPLTPMDAAPREGDFFVSIRLPRSLRPGRYQVRVECSDGSAAAAAVRAVSGRTEAALAADRRAAEAPPPAPWTPVSTGLGIAGVALMAVGAVAGGSALGLRRRAGARSLSRPPKTSPPL